VSIYGQQRLFLHGWDVWILSSTNLEMNFRSEVCECSARLLNGCISVYLGSLAQDHQWVDVKALIGSWSGDVRTDNLWSAGAGCRDSDNRVRGVTHSLWSRRFVLPYSFFLSFFFYLFWVYFVCSFCQVFILLFVYSCFVSFICSMCPSYFICLFFIL